MVVYLDLILLLNFTIDYMLLIGANRLCGYPAGWKRAIPAAMIGSVYAAMCLFPLFHPLSGGLGRICVLLIMGTVAYGFHRQALRRCGVFLLLSMALGGFVIALGSGGTVALICSVFLLALTCLLGIRKGIGTRSFAPIDIYYNGKHVSFVALCDTGNELRDPLSGESVLVVGARIAQELVGLSPWQLKKPVETLPAADLAGLRLISYRTVGECSGLMLGMRFKEVKVGNRMASRLVAFSPEKMSDGYEGLTGGFEI